jgi:hypothetical protein
MKRSLLALALLPGLLACTDRDAPRPVPVPDRDPAADATRPLSSRESLPPAATAAAPAVDPDDPAEPGISDLARLARYVFKAMQGHDDVCPFGNPLSDRLHFAFEIEVKAGRMTRVGLGHVGHGPEGSDQTHPIPPAQWPRELTGYVSCLEPHLKTLVMAPSPADGTYEPVYTFSGSPTGQAAH